MSLIIEMLQESCRKHAKKTALRNKVAGRWREYSYETVWNTSDQVAAGLAEWGVEAGDRIALLAPSSPTWVMVNFGILKSSAIAVPIDKDLKQGELRHILVDSGTRVLFTEQAYLETILDIAESLPDLKKIILLNQNSSGKDQLSPQAESALATVVSEWHRIRRQYRIDDADVENFEGLAESFHSLVVPVPTTVKPGEEKKNFFSRLLRARDEELPLFNVESLDDFKKMSPPPLSQSQSFDPALILYTSGTTGRSKGAMLSHANVVSNVNAAVEIFNLDSTMSTLSFLPINHVFEQVPGIILPLTVGGTVSFAESLRKLGDNLGEVKPNFLLGVPAVFRLLADRMTHKIEGQTLSKALFSFAPTRHLITKKVRKAFGGNPVFISGGAALDPVVAATLMELGLNVYQGYGITETSPVIAVETPTVNRLGTVGRPMPKIKVKIHEPNAEGVGEIWAKGPNIMLGYYNNQIATDEVITEGWYHTGDLGSVSDDGYLSICGRLKNLIVTANGKNVYPEEVENELSNSLFIAEVMVYGHKIDKTSEEVHAMIYLDQDALDAYASEAGKGPLNEQETESLIRKEVLERGKQLADYKRVKRFTLRTDEFPKTTTRKIKRFVVEADIDAEG
ncbi:MAG: AMP-binding protein [Deltaproteobacteria bacterium]|nr:AMP-binding protein [Deltaproteobacteria bacterium]